MLKPLSYTILRKIHHPLPTSSWRPTYAQIGTIIQCNQEDSPRYTKIFTSSKDDTISESKAVETSFCPLGRSHPQQTFSFEVDQKLSSLKNDIFEHCKAYTKPKHPNHPFKHPPPPPSNHISFEILEASYNNLTDTCCQQSGAKKLALDIHQHQNLHLEQGHAA